MSTSFCNLRTIRQVPQLCDIPASAPLFPQKPEWALILPVEHASVTDAAMLVVGTHQPSLRFPPARDVLHDHRCHLPHVRLALGNTLLHRCDELFQVRPRDTKRPSRPSPDARPDRAQPSRVNPYPNGRRTDFHRIRDLLDSHELRIHVGGRQLAHGIRDRPSWVCTARSSSRMICWMPSRKEGLHARGWKACTPEDGAPTLERRPKAFTDPAPTLPAKRLQVADRCAAWS